MTRLKTSANWVLFFLSGLTDVLLERVKFSGIHFARILPFSFIDAVNYRPFLLVNFVFPIWIM